MKVQKLLGYAILFFALSCAKKQDTSKCVGAPELDFEGTWQTQCISNGGGSYVQSFTLTCSSVTSSLDKYSNTTCAASGKTRTVQHIDDFLTVLGSSSSVSGATEVNIQQGEVSVTPQSSTEASNMNASSYCGKTNWVAGVSQIVHGLCGSDDYGSPGEMTYSIYKVLNSVFYYGVDSGDGHDGSSSAKRYDSLSSQGYQFVQ